MKILIVNTLDLEGGAARAAYRLHRGLLVEGIDSHMLVQSKSSDDFTVIGSQTKLQKTSQNLLPHIDYLPVRRYKNRTKTLFSPNWFPFSSMVNRINEISPDLVHLHWINHGMLRIEDFSKIKAPIVWSLHDMWAFTGGCHYDEACGTYKKNCGCCPVLGSYKSNDLSRKVWNRKQRAFGKINHLNIIGLSQWLADCAKQSFLFKNTPVFNLPNPIDTKAFSPFDKQQARELFNLPKNKKLILFGAMEATSDPRKGFKALSEALLKLKTNNFEFVVFGSSQPNKPPIFNGKINYLGRIHDDISLKALYSAVDVFVAPSLQENLSNTIMESLACSTPVVGFDIGGNSDLIEHKKNGYLAKPYDTTDLAHGIDWVLNSKSYNQLCEKAREKILKTFDSRIVVKQYIELYRHVQVNKD